MLTVEKKKSVKNGIARVVVVGLGFLIEILIIYAIFIGLNKYAEWIAIITRIVAFIIIINLYSSDKTSTVKLPWILIIGTFPLAGVLLYVMIGFNPMLRSKKKRFLLAHDKYTSKLIEMNGLESELDEINPYSANISHYIKTQSGFQLNRIQDIAYYPTGMEGLQAQLEAMSQAKKYIFMEYFAVENSDSWEMVEKVLERKVKEGVEVRVVYDDLGSIGFVNTDFAQALRKKGIQCHVFNAFVPGLNVFLNNRDHRKMTIIDGEIAFTGGYNIANEYFGLEKPYGYWKDTGLKLTGPIVNNFVSMFLEMWAVTDKKKNKVVDENTYFINHMEPIAENGYVHAYGETPMKDEKLAENVYISMIEAAKDYIWFVTPYLILTDEMIHAFTVAAKRGVDVRIITPGIPDKKIIYSVTRSYYHVLCKNGVQIYEYTPGFCHCKMCVSDDERAICGTINLDYRSLYHHFEDGVFLCNCETVFDIKSDFEEMLVQSHNVSEEYATGTSSVLKVKQLLLRFVAQLL